MSLKLFYSQLNLHSSALHECLKRCSPAMQACLETYDDTLYCNTMIPCIVPHRGRGYNGFGEKIRFWGRGGKGNANGGSRRNSLPPRRRAGLKGNAKRETRRNPLLLKLARSLKGNANGGSRRNPLPPRRGAGQKGSVNGGKH